MSRIAYSVWLRAVRAREDQAVRGLPDRTEIPPGLEPSTWSPQRSCGARVPPFFFTTAGGSNAESYSGEPATARIILTPKHFLSRNTRANRSSPMDVLPPRPIVRANSISEVTASSVRGSSITPYGMGVSQYGPSTHQSLVSSPLGRTRGVHGSGDSHPQRYRAALLAARPSSSSASAQITRCLRPPTCRAWT